MRITVRNLAILLCLVAISGIAYAGTSTFYHKTVCANGSTSAYTITEIDAMGCVLTQVGVNCDGGTINWVAPRIVIVGSDAGGLVTQQWGPGLTSSIGWYVRIEADSSGNPIRVWGRKDNGDYYVTW